MSVNRPSIAILEKDFAAREMYRRELEGTCEVFPCETGEEIWQILNAHGIHLIVLEPDGLGYNKWDLIKKIKSDPRSMDLPIILISSHEMRDGNIKKELAVSLVKPVLPSELLGVIRDVLHIDQ